MRPQLMQMCIIVVMVQYALEIGAVEHCLSLSALSNSRRLGKQKLKHYYSQELLESGSPGLNLALSIVTGKENLTYDRHRRRVTYVMRAHTPQNNTRSRSYPLLLFSYSISASVFLLFKSTIVFSPIAQSVIYQLKSCNLARC
jgi:hypothetical protein